MIQVSFDMSEYTADVDGIGTLRLLNAIRACGLEKYTRLYQVHTHCVCVPEHVHFQTFVNYVPNAVPGVGIDFGALRQGAGGPTVRDNPFLPPLAVRWVHR